MMTWDELLLLESRIAKARGDLNEAENAAARAMYDVDQLLEEFAEWKASHPDNPDNQEPEPDPDEEESTDPIPPDEENPDAQRGLLPEQWMWQKELYDWLASLTIPDVEIPTGAPVWDGTYPSLEYLAELYLEIAARSNRSDIWPGGVMLSESKWFVLDDGAGAGIEGSGAVRMARYASNPAYWYQRHFPNGGNPYYQHKGLARRALVSVAIDMMMTDHYHDHGSNPWGTNVWARDDPRFLGGIMNAWCYAYKHCKDVAPQAAFEAGFRRMALKLKARGVSRHTPNMQTRTVSAMAHLYRSTDNAEIKDLCLRTARKFMFGYEDGVLETNHALPQSLFYPAGYVQEGFSPETTYQGVSLYHLMEARTATEGLSEWDFMDEPIRRLSEFRTHQLFREPGRRPFNEGPSAYAGRTGGSMDRLQANHSWRDITVAGYYDEALPTVEGFFMISDDVMDADKLSAKLEVQLMEGGSFEQEFLRISTEEAPFFRIDHKHHWPDYVPYSPPDGWFDRLSALQDEMILPFEREGYFSRSFDDEFWSHKGDGFGFFVEALEDSGTYDAYRGGSLQAFWTPGTGIVLLGRKNKDEGDFAEIDKWPTNHVWGRTSAGLFSTALERRRDIHYNLDELTVQASGMVNSGAQQGPVDLAITNKFEALPNGLRIEHLASGVADELWATLPVYLKDAKHQPNLTETTIEYESGGIWHPMTSAPVEASTLRLGRDIGQGLHYVTVTLDGLHQVKLSQEPWQQTYQADSRVRSIHIAFEGSLTYEITV